jgi:hypothetical protein
MPYEKEIEPKFSEADLRVILMNIFFLSFSGDILTKSLFFLLKTTTAVKKKFVACKVRQYENKKLKNTHILYT